MRMIPLLVLLGCVSYSEGQAQRGELNCEWLDACGELDSVGYDGVDSCKAAADAQPYSDDNCPDYDAGAMQACLKAYRDAIASEDCTADLAAACQVCG
jgi:hypothetical protein